MTLYAIGGTGKSALAWTWFEALFQSTRHPVGGGMWYSFYETGASFRDFVRQGHAYFVRVAPPSADDEASSGVGPLVNSLLGVLGRQRAVLVLDGFERLLDAYARIDSLHLVADDDPDADPSRRRSADPDVDLFLDFLRRQPETRVLITSRLVPAGAQNDAHTDTRGCESRPLDDLTDDDVVNLFRSYGVHGTGANILAPPGASATTPWS